MQKSYHEIILRGFCEKAGIREPDFLFLPYGGITAMVIMLICYFKGINVLPIIIAGIPRVQFLRGAQSMDNVHWFSIVVKIVAGFTPEILA
jgi:hypothetical protein